MSAGVVTTKSSWIAAFQKKANHRSAVNAANGAAGTGEAKRRSTEHYARIGFKRSGNLDESKVREIRTSKLNIRQLAKKFNVSYSLIWYIKKRKRWANVK